MLFNKATTCWSIIHTYVFLRYSYIRKAFHHASDLVKPDAILFLGDLMNDGSISSDEEYLEFKARFDNIFDTSHLIQQPKVQ